MENADLPIAIMVLTMGLILLGLRGRVSSSRQQRVAAGDLSESEAKRKARKYDFSSAAIAFIGAVLVVRELLR